MKYDFLLVKASFRAKELESVARQAGQGREVSHAPVAFAMVPFGGLELNSFKKVKVFYLSGDKVSVSEVPGPLS